MTAFYIPKAMKGKTPDGRPYSFFRGIHNVPDSLANHRDANALGIKTVDEMTDAEWAGLALDKDKWLAANRPQPDPIDAVDEPEVKADPVPAPAAKPVASPVAPVSAPAATPAPASDAKSS